MTDCDASMTLRQRQDAHGSEYVSCADERRSFLTGFSGSSGSALVTADQVPNRAENICGLIYIQIAVDHQNTNGNEKVNILLMMEILHQLIW